MRPSVTVVGAGLTGLTAALRLQQAGHPVRVLERQDIPGGRMAQRRSGPIAYNTGARLIYPFGKHLHRLIDEMHLRQDMVPLRGLGARCVGPQGSWNVKLMPDISVLATPGLDIAGRLRLAMSVPPLALLRRKVDPDHAVSALQFDDETLADYVTRTLGTRVLRLLIDPIFRGTRSWNPEDISAAFYLSTTPHLLGKDTTYSLRHGMGQLTAALAQAVAVTCRARALRVHIPANETQACEIVCDIGGVPTTLHSDLVVCATEGAHAGQLVDNPHPEQQALHQAVCYNSLGIVHYALSGELAHSLEFSVRDRPSRIATWQQTPACETSQGCLSMLYCQLTPEATKEAMGSQRTQDLDQLIRGEVRARIPGFDQRLVHTYNQWIEYKLPLFYPGYLRRVKTFLDWQTSTRQRLYYCGDYLSQALLNGACASGNQIADIIDSHWH